MIQLQLEDKTIELNTHDVEGKTLYKAQDIRCESGLTDKQFKNKLAFFVESKGLINQPLKCCVKSGRYGGTFLNKRELLKLCGSISDDFEDAVYEAFESLLAGNTQDAINTVGKVAIDMEMVAKLRVLWKEYIKWAYSTYSSVNKMYGANLVRMVLEYSLGVSSKNSIKGLTKDDVIDRLVSQGHGDALLSMKATIELLNRTINCGIMNDKFNTYEGKRETYTLLKQLIDWRESE